jgi:hypothetical protein
MDLGGLFFRRRGGQAGVILAAAVVEPPCALITGEAIEEDAVCKAGDEFVRSLDSEAVFVRIFLPTRLFVCMKRLVCPLLCGMKGRREED